MCDLRGPDAAETRQVPCLVVESYIDEESLRLIVIVRCFRNANEVLNIGSLSQPLQAQRLGVSLGRERAGF